MESFKTLLQKLESEIRQGVFPVGPKHLYDPARYILSLGGKRIRPVLCLMGQQLFGAVSGDGFHAALAIELFHNFTLIHDDIMDEAPLRRGQPSVHCKYDSSRALLAGDVMLVRAYEQLEQINHPDAAAVQAVFSRTAREVCEGQQLDMDMAAQPLEEVKMADYMEMIRLKTSVLLAASLKMGGILGGGDSATLENLYAFGQQTGMAFQIQDDYLDAFGDPDKFGKQAGGDILSNKKTFLLIQAYDLANAAQRTAISSLLDCTDPKTKVREMLQLYRDCRVDQWAQEQKTAYMEAARNALDQVAVPIARKAGLTALLAQLLDREH